MLAPDDRLLLLESLRPPSGYELDIAVGTTFTLDLVALLRVPLAFSFFDWEDGKGEHVTDRLALFEAIRGVAGRMTVFCETGRISIPRDRMPLFAHLEECVCEVRAPRPNASFHPKVWALRFSAEDRPAQYRLLVASRNLTFDRSWDTLLCLDGQPGSQNERAEPLADFFEQLVGLGKKHLAPGRAKDIQSLANELRSVEWARPPGFYDGPFFHHFGLRGSSGPEVVETGRGPSLVVSPFIRETTLARILKRGDLSLVSREDELGALPRGVPEGITALCLIGDVTPDTQTELPSGNESEQPAADVPLEGVHAKLYLLEDDKSNKVRILTGSSNATPAGFDRNVEFMVELFGAKKQFGIEAFLEGTGGAPGMRPLLLPYRATEVSAERLEELRLEAVADTIHRALCATEWVAECIPDGDRWRLNVHGPRPKADFAGAAVTVYPATLPNTAAMTLSATEAELSAVFMINSLRTITQFFAFEITVRGEGGATTRKGFVRQLPTSGIPEGRMEAITADILTRAGVMRYLLYLASFDPSSEAPDALAGSARVLADSANAGDHPFSEFGPTLLEALLRMLTDCPSRLGRVDSLVKELENKEETAKLLPADFWAIWPAVRDVWLSAPPETGATR